VKPTIMLIGLGGLGSVILELLARQEGIGRVLVASRNREQGSARCNLARLGALAQGYDPAISFIALDLHNSEAVAETIQREAPTLILSTATMQTWWLPDLLPAAQAAAIKSAGFGMWLPVHLALSMKLMQALRVAQYQGLTLTAPFPDAVNCVLGRLNLAPTCGIGNLDEIVPKVRLLAAERLHTSPETLRVLLVAHHALEDVAFGVAGDAVPPYFLRIEDEGRDVTQEIHADELLLAPYPITAGPATHFLTAGSALRLVRALLSDDRMQLHAPGPGGLPGGYPIIASRAGVQLASIPGLSVEQAIAINEQAQRFDGIERIEADGTVIFRPQMVEAFRDLLGYECASLPPAEAEERARELIARFHAYASRYGVTLPR
jgi:NAD(P)-dependent dehydrogenase (short-subunit alcohol dehydrogenase family)